jgi:integrase
VRGQGRAYKHGVVWWIDYGVHGDRFRENTHKTSKREAFDVLRQRIGDRKAGKLTGNPDKVTFTELRQLIEQDYALKGNRSTDQLADALGHLEQFFGARELTRMITVKRVDEYAAKRRTSGAARATVAYEKAILRRAFNLAVEKGVLGVPLRIKVEKVDNARSGFFSPGDFAALVVEIRDPVLRRYLRAKHLLGWRDNELKRLLWSNVDRDLKEIRVAARDTKGKKPLLLPYGAIPDLQAIIEECWNERDGVFVFQRRGKPLKDYRGAWEAACRRAGLAWTVRDAETGELRQVAPIPHDLRRSAARDWRPYMSEREIMNLCGWKSRATFERYDIQDPKDVAAGIHRRYGTIAAQSDAPAPTEEHVS